MNKDSIILEAEDLTLLLSVQRSDDQKKWMEVGHCLHNINLSLLDSWIDFSRRPHEECQKIWKSIKLRDNGEGIATLNQWAEQDNPIEYEKYVKKSTIKAIRNTYKNENQIKCVAMVVHTMYKYKYKYTSMEPETGVLYEFINHKWRVVEPSTLIDKIKNNIIDLYNNCGGEIANIINLTNKLREEEFINLVIDECLTLFYDKNFESRLDLNCYLIAFENGVYDLRTHEFRNGELTDYLSLTTGNNYIEFQDNDQLLVSINQFMSEIFPDNDVRNYVWILLASFLEGGNPHEKFYIWISADDDSNNGIEQLLQLFKLAFGKYVEKSPPAFLTNSQDRYELANTEAARLRNLRFVSIKGLTLAESSHGGTPKLNANIVKEWTGGDRITYNLGESSQKGGLWGPLPTYKPQFKMVYHSNILPYLPPKDEAIWRRLSVLDCQFPIKKDIDLNLWKEAFIYILLQNYKIYKKDGLITPQSAIKITQKYRQYCFDKDHQMNKKNIRRTQLHQSDCHDVSLEITPKKKILLKKTQKNSLEKKPLKIVLKNPQKIVLKNPQKIVLKNPQKIVLKKKNGFY
jgi:hypothetical protein